MVAGEKVVAWLGVTVFLPFSLSLAYNGVFGLGLVGRLAAAFASFLFFSSFVYTLGSSLL